MVCVRAGNLQRLATRVGSVDDDKVVGSLGRLPGDLGGTALETHRCEHRVSSFQGPRKRTWVSSGSLTAKAARAGAAKRATAVMSVEYIFG